MEPRKASRGQLGRLGLPVHVVERVTAPCDSYTTYPPRFKRGGSFVLSTFELCTTTFPNAISKEGLVPNSLRGVNVTLRGICYERGVTFARKLSETAQHAVPVSYTSITFLFHSIACYTT